LIDWICYEVIPSERFAFTVSATLVFLREVRFVLFPKLLGMLANRFRYFAHGSMPCRHHRLGWKCHSVCQSRTKSTSKDGDSGILRKSDDVSNASRSNFETEDAFSLSIGAIPLEKLLAEDRATQTGNRIRDGRVIPDDSVYEEIPHWAVDGEPIWLDMMHNFLFNQRPQCILLDVDQQPLPIFDMPVVQELKRGSEARGYSSFESGSGMQQGHRSSQHCDISHSNLQQGRLIENIMVTPSPDDTIARDFRYFHIPKPVLPKHIAHLDRDEPLAIFGGTTHCSRQAEALLRQEGFTRLCNVRTYRYLRSIVKICAERGL
jgi:hypothetical protein